jgi:uncharacterized membrane protein
MLRPATPLAGLFFIAFLLLLLSSLTVPVIKGLSLAVYDGSRFGVWGYCADNGNRCSGIEVGYTIDELSPTKEHFNVNEETRHNVSYILIVHPIAAFMSFVCFSMALAAHWHSPGHSPRFLMALFLMTLPTFLAALLAFLIDVLLFIPHLSIGGWLVLAAVIVMLLASIVTCGMRRTLISRKARRKRIAENAEMSGENYYAQQAAKTAYSGADSPPPLSGSSGSPLKDKAMAFGSYESANTTVIGDQSTLGQQNIVRALNLDASRNQAYDRPPPVNPQMIDTNTNPYADSVPIDYYNQAGPVRQESSPYTGPSQYRNRGGLTSPTYAYSQQRGGKMGGPPQYGYDSPPRGPPRNTYNNGNGGRGGGMGPQRDIMGPPGEINPYQANISDLAARTNMDPTAYRNNGYPPAGQRQQGLYSDR